MRLGTRWAAGQEPPASVPAQLRAAIADVDARPGSADARWTLTWLEGRPVAESDAGWEALLDASGEVVVRAVED
ncbi:MAG: hypothetical protein QM677_08995 [Microbacterium sp.]